MKTTNIITTLSLAAMIGAASSMALAETARSNAPVQWLPLQQVLTQMESAGFTNIEEIERDDGRYEVKATNAEGVRTKLYLNGETGEVLKQREMKRDMSKREMKREHKANKHERRHDQRMQQEHQRGMGMGMNKGQGAN